MKRVLVTLLVILAVGLGAFFVLQMLDQEDTASELQQGAEETANQVDQAATDDDLLTKILENPAAYYNQEVTVEGEIQDVYSTRVFKISDQTIGQELWVITQVPLTTEQMNEAEEFFEDNADVVVTGTLRQMTVVDIEREFSIDLPAEAEVEFADKPVLVATRFTFSDGQAVFDFDQGVQEDTSNVNQ